MSETVLINQISYEYEKTDSEIHLKRFHEKYKTWVHLHLPLDMEKNDSSFQELIDRITDLYIEKKLEQWMNEFDSES